MYYWPVTLSFEDWVLLFRSSMRLSSLETRTFKSSLCCDVSDNWRQRKILIHKANQIVLTHRHCCKRLSSCRFLSIHHEQEAEQRFQTYGDYGDCEPHPDHFASLCAKLHVSRSTRPLRLYQVPPMATLMNTNVCDNHIKKGTKLDWLQAVFYFRIGRVFVPLNMNAKTCYGWEILWSVSPHTRVGFWAKSRLQTLHSGPSILNITDDREKNTTKTNG